jgi:ectoine hydroxylase-related dioxygenase (phytanoyl-CoA dioxygenase family)
MAAALPTSLTRAVTETEVDALWRDGVVHLPGVLPTSWIDALEAPVERTVTTGELVDLGAYAAEPAGDAPRFAAGTDHWRHDDTFRAFATASPLAAIAAAVLRSDAVFLWEDSVLVKEPGTPHETRFHADAGYFQVTGEQVCTIWVPLDAATPESGVLHFVRGSHREDAHYRPNFFVSDEPLPDTVGDLVPDVFGDPELAARVVSFDVVPGDVTVHHYRTLHGAPPNRSVDRRRRAVSVRYCGADARYVRKPGLAERPGCENVADGAELAEPWCPQVWPPRGSSDDG